MYRMANIFAFIGVVISGASFAADDDAARGKTAYEANCAACHTVVPGKQGFGPVRHTPTASAFRCPTSSRPATKPDWKPPISLNSSSTIARPA